MSDLARIRTNVAAIRAYKMLTDINNRIIKTSKRLSTGKVFNSAADSPSGYYISKTMQLDIDRLKRLQQNIERGMNWLQSNDGRLAHVVDLLAEMNDIASQAASGGITSAERVALQIDMNGFIQEIQSILQSGVSSTLYSGFNLGPLENISLSGTAAPTITELGINSLVLTGSSSATQTMQNVESAMTAIKSAMDRVLKDEEFIGSWIHRLEFHKAEAEVDETNMLASLSTVQDADFAKEQMELTKLQILQQTALTMLTQANTAPSALLALFGG